MTEEDNPYKPHPCPIEDTADYKRGYKHGYSNGYLNGYLIIALLVANLLGLVYLCGLIVASNY